MRIVALTGGIACGKSTVSKKFKELGAAIVDADKIFNDLLEPTNSRPSYLVIELEGVVGKDLIGPDNRIIRKVLRDFTFANDTNRKLIEDISHSKIRFNVELQTKKALDEGYKVCICDIPLLFETGTNKNYKEIIVVWSDKDTQLKRLLERNKELTKEEAINRINIQKSLDYKVAHSTWTIVNNDLKNTYEQIENLYKELLNVG